MPKVSQDEILRMIMEASKNSGVDPKAMEQFQKATQGYDPSKANAAIAKELEKPETANAAAEKVQEAFGNLTPEQVKGAQNRGFNSAIEKATSSGQKRDPTPSWVSEKIKSGEISQEAVDNAVPNVMMNGKAPGLSKEEFRDEKNTAFARGELNTIAERVKSGKPWNENQWGAHKKIIEGLGAKGEFKKLLEESKDLKPEQKQEILDKLHMNEAPAAGKGVSMANQQISGSIAEVTGSSPVSPVVDPEQPEVASTNTSEMGNGMTV